MAIFNDAPSDDPCHSANPDLWELFVAAFKKSTGRVPQASDWWSEATVVQWVDLSGAETDNLLGFHGGRSKQHGYLLSKEDGEARAHAA